MTKTDQHQAKKSENGAGVCVAYVAGLMTANDGAKDIPDGNGGTTKVANLVVNAPNGIGGTTPVYVEVFGPAAAAAAGAIASGKRVQVSGEIRTDEWGPEGKQDRKLLVHVEEGEEGHEIGLAQAAEDLNEAHVAGDINYVAEPETMKWKSRKDGESKSLPKRRMFVSVPKTSPKGKSIRPSLPVEVLGDAAGGDFRVGNRVEIHGIISNRMEEGKDGAKNRYFASVVVGADDHKIQLAS